MVTRWNKDNRTDLERILTHKMSEWIRSPVPFLPFDSWYSYKLTQKDTAANDPQAFSAPGPYSSAR